ncbi:MAG: GNAT family N-acetyltransferase [Pyrinomonadaceae bacterium]|nr:GNAT family N-acetyltransferase [Pyrinomonadaceae bacterium]
MTQEIKIRIAEEEDAGSMIEFNQAMALETEAKRLEPEKIKEGVEAVFSDERKGFYVVAENEEERIIGGLMITYEWSDWRNGWFWWIQSVYVLPEARGEGIYSRLYEFVKEKALSEGGVCGFRLYVDLENKHAQKVYESVGMFASNYLIFGEEFE